MHAVIKKCCGRLAETGFFEEWARAVERKLEPAVLATYVLEAMKSDDSVERQTFTMFVNFIHTRTWPEVFNELVAEVDEALIKAFSISLTLPKAEEFFVKFQRLVVDQVEDYWRQYAASQKKEAIEVLSALERTPIDKLEERIRTTVEARMAGAVQTLTQQ